MTDLTVNSENISLINDALQNGVANGHFYPSVYVIDPMSKCNIACVMCPNSQMKPDQIGAIDLDDAENIFRSIAPYAEFVMLYWMGEPMLHPEFSSLLELARKHIRGRIVVSSNMTVYDPEIYQSLANCADIVLCCIDRWDAEAYEKIRRGACFADVVANTEKLIALCDDHSRCEVVVKGLDIKHNSEEFSAFSKHWQSLGARTLLAWLNTWSGTMPSVRNAANVPIPRVEQSRVACSDLWFKMVIDWQGRVQMCCFDWQYRNQIGKNIDQDWISEIWQGQKMTSLREAHLAKKYYVTKLCSTCDAWGEPEEHSAYTDWSEKSYFTVF